MCAITVTVPCYPTEAEERVALAVRNIFPDAEMQPMEGGKLTGTAQGTARFGKLLAEQNIRDAARGRLRGGIVESGLRFRLNKQAAYAGKVSFAIDGAPLGDIEVFVETEEAEALVDRLTLHDGKEEGAE